MYTRVRRVLTEAGAQEALLAEDRPGAISRDTKPLVWSMRGELRPVWGGQHA